tara:strand:+ start:1176 stop:2141 length:966 start_codon:yes stop_codon:yes gene_type:complete
MAELNVRGQLTLVELAKRTNNGNLLTIAEVLEETNEIFTDAPWLEANQTTSHIVTRRNSLPTGTYRKLNKGVPSESSTTTQVVEAISMLESYSKVDAKLVKIAPNPVQFRSQEDMAFVEGLSQTSADTLIYGNMGANPERFNGFMTRANELSDNNVVNNGGGGSDTTSILIVQWGPSMCHLTYPKGSKTMGIQARDLGEDTVLDDDNNEYQAFRTHFTIDMGLVVRDDRCVQRIANIESSGSSNIFDDDVLIRRLRVLPYKARGAVIYGNRTILAQMDIKAKDKSNVNYDTSNIFGVPVTTFRGVPVRQVDAILDTETAVT